MPCKILMGHDPDRDYGYDPKGDEKPWRVCAKQRGAWFDLSCPMVSIKVC